MGQGYYLIAETATDGSNDAISLVMLDTAGQQNVKVKSKESIPTLEKKIKLEDGTLVDMDTVAFTDTVTFQLTATLPKTLEQLIKRDSLPAAASAVTGNDGNAAFKDLAPGPEQAQHSR